MRTQVSIEIDRPIEEVFQLTTSHVAEWSIVVVEDELIEEKSEGVGTTFRTVTEENGKRMEFQGVVTRYNPPHISVIKLTNNVLVIETEFRFEDISGHTRVIQNAKVSGKGIYKPMMLLFGWLAKKSSCQSSENELASLKRFCEYHSEVSAK